jgi:transposase
MQDTGRPTREELSSLTKEALLDVTESLYTDIEVMKQQMDGMEKNIDLLIEQLKVSSQARFGKKTEKDIIQGQMELAFNEAEADSDPAAEEPSDIEQVIPSYKRRVRPAGKREADLSTITDIRIENHELSEDELKDIFKDGFKRLPDEVYSRLEYHPAGLEVVEHHVAVYAGMDNQTIVKGKRPADLFRNSIATPSLVAGIMHAKYANSLPLYRQEQGFIESEVNLSRQTMANWMVRSAEDHLSLMYDSYKEHLMGQHLIHADETPVEVRKDGRAAMANSYMWVYRSAEREDRKVVLYDYEKTRKAEHPNEFLDGYNGTVMCDGYQVYHQLGRQNEGITIANCWVHARRRFANVVKSLGAEKARGTLAAAALVKIAEIYHQDNPLWELPDEQRKRERQRRIRPLVEEFFAWVRQHQSEVPSQSETGKGFTYCLNQEIYLKRFLDDPAIPLDNNAAERSIRSFCVGKHNWHVIDTVAGAQASAIIYSIVETAKANDIKVYPFLVFLLTEIPKHIDGKDMGFIEDLLPWSPSLPESCRKKTKAATR